MAISRIVKFEIPKYLENLIGIVIDKFNESGISTVDSQAGIYIHAWLLSNSLWKLKNRLGTEPYARWCGRSVDKIIIYLLPDFRN